MTEPDNTRKLRSGALVEIGLSPADGARVSSLRIRGHEVLLTDRSAGPIGWGLFPMVPWAGRLGYGRFVFNGQQIDVPIDHPPHAIHGFGYSTEWEEIGPTRFRLDMSRFWPLGGWVEHEIDLGQERLICILRVGSTHSLLPVVMGWHPWFRTTISGSTANLGFAAKTMYERGADGLPTGRLVPFGTGPWDDCFSGVDQPVTIEWPGLLKLSLSSSVDHWVVFDERSDGFCVEPQSAPPDALRGRSRVLPPGEVDTEWFEIQWRELEHEQ